MEYRNAYEDRSGTKIIISMMGSLYAFRKLVWEMHVFKGSTCNGTAIGRAGANKASCRKGTV
jgi:hypothetical protein